MRIHGRRLRSLENVRVLLANTLRKLEQSGNLGEPDRAKVVIQGAHILANIMRDSQVEERLAKIEKALDAMVSQPISTVGDVLKISVGEQKRN